MARPQLICLALALITLVAYSPVRQHEFILYDDPQYIVSNRMVNAGLTAAGVKWACRSWYANNWHPVTWLSHMLDCELFGLDAGAHHLISVMFHAANAALLLLVLLRMTGSLWASAFVAALFAWHPLHVESVAWAAERKDVLSTFFLLLTLWAYLSWLASSTSTPSVRRRTFCYLLALAFFALGLMCKPMLVTLPFVLVLLNYWPLGRMDGSPDLSRSGKPTAAAVPRRQPLAGIVAEIWPFFLLAAASCVITFLAQREEAVTGLEAYPLSLRMGNALVSYGRYLLKAAWPANLAICYPLPPQFAWPWPSVAASIIALMIISCVAWRMRRSHPHLLVGWLWFLGVLVPVIGLVQVGSQAIADRYTYFPLVGIFVALVFEARYWVSRLRLGPALPAALAGLVLAGCLFATVRQLRWWTDSRSLFTHVLAVTGDNAVASVNLGMALEGLGRRDEALKLYEQAVVLDPGLVQAHNNLGNLLDAMGRSDEAMAHYREGLRLKPATPMLHENLGALLVKRGRYDEALAQYTEAAQLNPSEPRPLYLMGKAMLLQGRSADAVSRFREALRLDPSDIATLTWLARVLAADRNPAIRNGTEAVALAERAGQLAGGDEPQVLDTLGMAYAEAGRFTDATQAVRRALDCAVTAGKKDSTGALEERLRLYQERQPYREVFSKAVPGTSAQ